MGNFPFRLPNIGPPQAAQVQADLDFLLSSISDSITISGDFITTGAGKGLIVTTPDGLHTYRIAVGNDGSLTTELLT